MPDFHLQKLTGLADVGMGNGWSTVRQPDKPLVKTTRHSLQHTII